MPPGANAPPPRPPLVPPPLGGSQLCPRSACVLGLVNSDRATYRHYGNISATTILSRVPGSNSYALMFFLYFFVANSPRWRPARWQHCPRRRRHVVVVARCAFVQSSTSTERGRSSALSSRSPDRSMSAQPRPGPPTLSPPPPSPHHCNLVNKLIIMKIFIHQRKHW